MILFLEPKFVNSDSKKKKRKNSLICAYVEIKRNGANNKFRACDGGAVQQEWKFPFPRVGRDGGGGGGKN